MKELVSYGNLLFDWQFKSFDWFLYDTILRLRFFLHGLKINIFTSETILKKDKNSANLKGVKAKALRL